MSTLLTKPLGLHGTADRSIKLRVHLCKMRLKKKQVFFTIEKIMLFICIYVMDITRYRLNIYRWYFATKLNKIRTHVIVILKHQEGKRISCLNPCVCIQIYTAVIKTTR